MPLIIGCLVLASDHRFCLAAGDYERRSWRLPVGGFRDNDIDAEVLLKLTAEDLISIGVTSVGHRRKLLDAIASFGMAVPAAVVTAPAPGAPAQVGAERRQLTVMFCELVGSTALSGLTPERRSLRRRSSAQAASIQVASITICFWPLRSVSAFTRSSTPIPGNRARPRARSIVGKMPHCAVSGRWAVIGWTSCEKRS
jgi:hypothetical protein